MDTILAAPVPAGNQNNSARSRAVGGVWGWGTGGCLSLLYYTAMLVKAGLRFEDPTVPDFRTIGGLDLLASTRQQRRRLFGVDVSFNPTDIFVPDGNEVPELHNAFAKDARMNRWAQAIEGCPGTIERGAGQEPSVGASFLVHAYEPFSRFVAAKLAAQRNPDLLRDAVHRGQQPRVGQKPRQINFATGFGGTGCGTAALGMMTQLLQRNQEMEIVLVCSSQPGEQDADANRKLNLCTFLRQIVHAIHNPVHLPVWQRDLLKEGRPLVDSIVLVSPETRYLSLNREVVYCAMARAAFEFMEGDPAVDQYYRDHEVEAALGGIRVYQTFGHADLILDAERTRRMLIDIARQQLCQRLLYGPSQTQL